MRDICAGVSWLALIKRAPDLVSLMNLSQDIFPVDIDLDYGLNAQRRSNLKFELDQKSPKFAHSITLRSD